MSECVECGRDEGHYLNCESAPKPDNTVKAPTRRTRKENTDE